MLVHSGASDYDFYQSSNRMAIECAFGKSSFAVGVFFWFIYTLGTRSDFVGTLPWCVLGNGVVSEDGGQIKRFKACYLAKRTLLWPR